jgi:hypothetical protein
LAGKVRVPHEAAALHQAIRDAETGRAQAANPLKPDGAEVIQNAEGEMIIPDAGGITLEEGEVMRLPPTPSMMVGDDAGIGARSVGRRQSETSTMAAMPTPPRLPSRPAVVKRDSSTSNYAATPEPYQAELPIIPASELDQSVSKLLPGGDELPPAYPADLPPLSDSHIAAHPSDDKAELRHRDEAAAGELMSESEKREWAEAEEMIRLEKEEMARLQRDSAGQSSGHGTAQDPLPSGVKGIHIEP